MQGILRIRFQRGGTAGKEEKRNGEQNTGKEFFDFADATARQGFYEEENTPEKDFGMDFLWFLWCGRNSPVFGRDRITTFERALSDDPEVWTEPKNPYYKLADSPEFCDKVLTEFGLGTTVYNRICLFYTSCICP